jgi:hypothetical protein
LGVVALAGTAHGAETPLLVAVEVAPGLDVGPVDVRQTVASELGMPVVGPREPTADSASDVLLVGIDVRELRMSLRAGAALPVSRAIAMPSDRSGRLRAIGWLAGNLVRDQVGPIVSVGGRAPTDPPPAVATTELPRMTETTTPDAAAPAAVVAGRFATVDDDRPHPAWTVTVAGGPTLLFWTGEANRMLGGGGGVYELALQHQATPESILLGAALQLGPQGDYAWMEHYLGMAAFVGSRWQSGRLFTEATVGLGLEVLARRVVSTSITNNSMTGTTSETRVSFEPEPAAYARLQGAGGVRLSGMFELVAQLGAHVSSDWKLGSYLSSMLGVRMRLQ